MTDQYFRLSPTDAPTRFSWSPSPLLLTPMATLQGGAALGAAVTAMETVTGRPAIWATAQYLSFSVGTAQMDLQVAVAVSGHNTSQARCTLSREGTEILTAQAALGSRNADITGVWCEPPVVPPPDDCERYSYFERGKGHLGDLVDCRLAIGRQLADIVANGQPGGAEFAVWIRTWSEDVHQVTVADLAFIGDFMPLAFAGALGKPYAGNSLDNTLRVGRLTTTRWVLLSCHVQHAQRGIGFGRAELWADDGTLLGAVSQTALLRTFGDMR